MNQLKFAQVSKLAGKIKNLLRQKELMETALINLIEECHQKNDDFYLALDWLASKNEIVFLKTPKGTYVLPVK